MYPIVRREQFGPMTFLWEVGAPDVARAARPGHFVMARIDEHGERIPLTVADFNAARGTVTVVIQAVGKTTHEMMGLAQGDYLLDFIGPLGPAQRHTQTRRHRGAGRRRTRRGARLSAAPRNTSGWAIAPFPSSASARATWSSGRSLSAPSATASKSPPTTAVTAAKDFVTTALADVLAAGEGRVRSGSHRADPHDAGLLRGDAAAGHPHHREPELHHGGWHRHVRLLPRDRGRRHEIRLRGWRRFRRPPGEFRGAGAAAEAFRARGESRPWSASAARAPAWRP